MHGLESYTVISQDAARLLDHLFHFGYLECAEAPSTLLFTQSL